MSPSRAAVEYLESVVYDRRDPLAAGMRGILRALAAVYRASLWAYLLPFDIGLRRKRRLDRPVISVGNITVGGTGKTPTTQHVCRGLLSRGWNPAVLSYGYGGTLRGRLGVVSDRTRVLLPPDTGGDEPAMLAAGLPGVPVLVCKNRDESGGLAIENLAADCLVLDDGYQVWKLHRDLDIVLVNARSPFDNGFTLPAGRLREPTAALRRADCVIVTGTCEPEARENALSQVREVAPAMPVYFGTFKPSAVKSLANGSETEVESIRGKKVLALSSLANPASFEETLTMTGAVIVDTQRFPDHHLYSAEDVSHADGLAAKAGADLILTTDKDAVKLDAAAFAVPVMTLCVELGLDDETSFWELIERKIGTAPGSGQN